jgi:hypothetical protein
MHASGYTRRPRPSETSRLTLLETLEVCYDAVPHPLATTEESGPFTLGAALTAALVEGPTARRIRTVFLSAGDDAVARVYERVGFARDGTACVAEAPRG